MLIYIICFGISIITYIVLSKGRIQKPILEKKNSNYWRVDRVSFAMFFSSLFPMLVAAFRYNVGTDYFPTYYTGFYRILQNSKADRFEIGYYWLNKVIQLFTDNVFVLFIITSILFVEITYKAIKNLSINIPFSIILFFVTRYYFIGLNAVRQFVAMSILLCSMQFIIERKFKKFIICIICACMFHYISILFIPIYFLNELRITKRKIVIWSVVDILLFSFSIELIKLIFRGTKYGILLDSFSVAGIGFTVFTITINFFLMILAYIGGEKNKDDPKYTLFFNMQVFAFLITLMLRNIPVIERVYWLFSFPIIISLPYFLKYQIKYSKFIKYGILIILVAYMIYDIAILGDHNVVPYDSIFGKKPIYDSGWLYYTW